MVGSLGTPHMSGVAIANHLMFVFNLTIFGALSGAGNPGERAAMLMYGQQYLKIMLWGLVPFALSQCYSSALGETGETMLPMIASSSAVAVNLIFNYLLIFGKLGFPALAAGTVTITQLLSTTGVFGTPIYLSVRHRMGGTLCLLG